MDNRPNFVDKSRPRERPNSTRCTAEPRLAQSTDSTRSVGSRGRGSHPASGPLESLPIDHSLPERVLLRGYGLDPDDLELERIRR